MERAEPQTEPAEDQTERTIAKAENEPRQEARCQEMSRQAQKAKNGNGSEEAEKRGAGDVALQRKAFEERGMIGNNEPCGENQSQANPHVNTGAYRRVAEDVEPTITGQLRVNRHRVLGSQDASNRLTASYGDGGVTSTTTGASGALSFPARSTAVTVYQ